MLLQKKKKQKSPLAFSLASQQNALENKPRTIHRVEKLELSSPWVLHEGDSSQPCFLPAVNHSPPSSASLGTWGGLSRLGAGQGENSDTKSCLCLSVIPPSCLVETKRTEIDCSTPFSGRKSPLP